MVHGFYGPGCNREPAVTCEVGTDSGTCMNQMRETRINQANEMSFAFGETCVNVHRDYKTLYVDMPDEPVTRTECRTELVSFYDAVQCLLPDLVPTLPS